MRFARGGNGRGLFINNPPSVSSLVHHSSFIIFWSRSGVFQQHAHDGLAILLAANLLAALLAFGVNPGDAVNDDEILHAVAHGASPFAYAAVVARSALFAVPTHHLLFGSSVFKRDLLMAGFSIIFGARIAPMRSMCRCMP